MRIVHVITRLIVGGAQENTILSCEGLANLGHEVILLTGPTTGPEGSLVTRARSGAYAFEEIPCLVRAIDPIQDFRAMRVLRRRFEVLSPDVVHTHSSKAGILGRLAAHAAKVPKVVHTIHGMSFNRTQSRMTQSIFAAAERYCARRSHAIVCVADAMTQQALQADIGRPEQYETIRSGMEVERFDPAAIDPAIRRREWQVNDHDILVGTVARLFENKGYEQLIEVMKLALSQEPRLRFVWVGDGADRARYEAELENLSLRDRVTITGLRPPSEMPEILGSIDLLAHTSQWEGLPRAVVQALLMERPAISYDIDGAPEVIAPGRTGELASLGDHRAFADALVRLARDPVRRAAYGKAGRAECLQRFDAKVMVDALDALYRRN